MTSQLSLPSKAGLQKLWMAVGLLSAALLLTLAGGARSFCGPQTQAPANHGLLLTLSQEQNAEPADSTALKNCLDHHPRPACVLLTVALKNEGTETILSASTSCGERVWFDLMKADGSWEPFSRSNNFLDWPICSRNVPIFQILTPGDSNVRHLRLADLGLQLDALASPDFHPIRAHLTVSGCVASDKAKPYKDLSLLTANSVCVPGTAIVQRFAILQSPSLNLEVNAALR